MGALRPPISRDTGGVSRERRFDKGSARLAAAFSAAAGPEMQEFALALRVRGQLREKSFKAGVEATASHAGARDNFQPGYRGLIR